MEQGMSDKSRDRVLIADDNEANVELLEAYLADMDVDLAVAVDGQDTLDKAAAFDPHLILLDVMMPKLSGFEVCQKLKGDPKSSRIMVLMVTALNEQGDMERGVESGADDFLSKPVNKEALLKRVQLMLKLRNVTDELERLRQYIEEMEAER
jgi:CheY-like chemotaxis protein